MKKFYYYIYYQLYHFGIKISDDALNEWKPGAFLTSIEGALVAEIIIWLQVFNLTSQEKINFLWSTPVIIVIAGILGFTNYYIFLYKDKWKKYSKEFAAYNKYKRFWHTILVVLLIIFAFISIILSIWFLYHQ